jgi:hypothetical protein
MARAHDHLGDPAVQQERRTRAVVDEGPALAL